MGENSAIQRLQRDVAACLAACLFLALSACANSYAGIPLKPGSASPDLQDLARRAQAGDKHAQLELGIRYEEGRGVPVDGTVQQLVVATVGGVVQPAQPLMVIVPDDSAVEVEAMIQNKDIGFIREGQNVRVKLEAFPFTDYGLIEGVVDSISRDAIDQSQQGAQRDEKNRPVQPGLVYAARIRLNKRTLNIAGRKQPIGPGLAVQAEIKTGDRRIIQYLLSPIAQSLDEAGRER